MIVDRNNIIYKVLSWARLYVVGFRYSFFMKIFSVFSVRHNKIMIVNYAGKSYGDNAKYIAENLVKPELRIYWAVNKDYKDDLPDYIKPVRFNSLRYFYHLATARVWLNNSRFYYGIQKRAGQYYIQTWHSSLRLKKIEKDAESLMSPRYIATCKRDSNMIDLITSGCEFSTHIYKNSFWYVGNIYECGTPRCDILLNKNKHEFIRRKIISKYEIDKSKKIVLYAPTFRRNKIGEEAYLDCEKFSKLLDEDCVVLARMHPISSFKFRDSNRVVDVTKHPDMQELLCAADFLITDYSGCCFDMMIAKKPCILYTPDLEEYLKNERDLYFSFDELPFDKVDNINELVKNIKNFDYKKYSKNIQRFGEKIGLCEDGKASERIAKLIIDKCEGKHEQG